MTGPGPIFFCASFFSLCVGREHRKAPWLAGTGTSGQNFFSLRHTTALSCLLSSRGQAFPTLFPLSLVESLPLAEDSVVSPSYPVCRIVPSVSTLSTPPPSDKPLLHSIVLALALCIADRQACCRFVHSTGTSCPRCLAKVQDFALNPANHGWQRRIIPICASSCCGASFTIPAG